VKDTCLPTPPPGDDRRPDAAEPLPGGRCISMLEVLYDVAASTSNTRDVSEVLMRFLHTLVEIVHGKAGAVRLRDERGELHLVASVGMDDDLVEAERILPAKTCICGKTDIDNRVVFQSSLRACDQRVGKAFFGNGERIAMVVVPLLHQGRNLGVYNLYVERDQLDSYRQYEELFTCIGRYLGMAIEKARLDEETARLSLMEERTRLANELHDSLAQTLASVRFQVRVMDENLHRGDEASLWESLERIENSLDEANAELRELIAHFRAPYDQQGVIAGVERVVGRFQRRSGIPCFLHKDWPKRRLPAEYELQIVRIVQEALANIRKHADAKTVRILLRGDDEGNYRVLIEDDGVGLPERLQRNGHAGEHIGLSIMKDRARRIGGELTIDSEPGEGTRVVLEFRLPEALRMTLDSPKAAAS